MATQHTPGPWKFEPHGAYASDFLGEDWPLGYISQASPPVPIFALGPILEYPTDQLLANGRLIAAAPELLEALNACRAHIALMTNQMQQFVEPSGYTAFDRKRIAFEHDREVKERLFMGDMIYLLDGPEQRELSSKCDAALAKIGGAA